MELAICFSVLRIKRRLSHDPLPSSPASQQKKGDIPRLVMLSGFFWQRGSSGWKLMLSFYLYLLSLKNLSTVILTFTEKLENF